MLRAHGCSALRCVRHPPLIVRDRSASPFIFASTIAWLIAPFHWFLPKPAFFISFVEPAIPLHRVYTTSRGLGLRLVAGSNACCSDLFFLAWLSKKKLSKSRSSTSVTQTADHLKGKGERVTAVTDQCRHPSGGRWARPLSAGPVAASTHAPPVDIPTLHSLKRCSGKIPLGDVTTACAYHARRRS